MNSSNRRSRMNKFDKRRKTTKTISILLIVGSILITVLILMLIFGDKSNKTTEKKTSNLNIEEIEKDDEKELDAEVNNSEDIDEVQTNEEQDIDEIIQVETEQVETSDSNVIEAYTGNWQPVGTEQSEPHTVVFDKVSQDWSEMEEAIRVATGLDKMTVLWLGNNGEQKAIGTVMTEDKSRFYRVSLIWVPNEGWKPTMLEQLKKSDK